MKLNPILNITRLAIFGVALLSLNGCVTVPYQTPVAPYQPQYQRQPPAPSYRGPYNDSGSTVHCGVDRDHRPHWYHSRMHHQHYCPGGPHHHH